MDADMTIRQEGELPPLTSASYLIPHAGGLSYRIKRLVRGDLHWRYEGVTHEYLTAEEEHEQENLDALVIEHFADGGSRHDKFERDMALLGAELERDPTDARSTFYLAQTMRDMGRREEAIALYERRAEMGGWGEEVYYALLQAGILKDESGDWPGAMDALSRAWEERPQRLEACFELVSRLRKRGNYRAGHALASAGINRAEPDDILFTHPWVYTWGLLFEYSVVAYWAEDAQGSLEACDRLLAIPDLPEAYRLQTLRNREFAVARQAEQSNSIERGKSRKSGARI
jgi:tetratricopeptide (TPR) repeat protein